MRYLYLIPALALILNPLHAFAADNPLDDKRNAQAPIILTPKLSDSARKDMDVNVFRGLGRFFQPKEAQKKQAPSGSPVAKGKLTSREDFVARYSADRQNRLDAARTETYVPPTAENNPYNATLLRSFNPYTHYQDPNTGQVKALPNALDPKAIAVVQETVTAYAAEKGVSADELMKNPNFYKKVERFYAQTVKKQQQEAAIQARKDAADNASKNGGT